MKYLKTMEHRDPDRVDHKKSLAEYRMYRKHLLNLKTRLSRKTWDYFWLGLDEKSIHDARLISFSVGDLRSRARPKLRVTADFLSQTSKSRLLFSYSQIRQLEATFSADRGEYVYILPGRKKWFNRNAYFERNQMGDVVGDELTRVDDKYLRHEIIFQSSARIVVVAARISFQRKGLK